MTDIFGHGLILLKVQTGRQSKREARNDSTATIRPVSF